MATKCTVCGVDMAWRPLQKKVCATCQSRSRVTGGSSSGREVSRHDVDDDSGVLLWGAATAEPERDSCRGSSYDGGGYDGGSNCDSGGSDSSSSWD